MPELTPVEEILTRLEKSDDLNEDQVEEFKAFTEKYYQEITYGAGSVRLNSLYAKAFQNITKKSVYFGGDNKIIHGENSQGKTSFLKALQFNLLGLPDDRMDHRMTNLIRDSTDTLQTRGEWLIDDDTLLLHRQMVRTGRGGKLSEFDKPTMTESPDEGAPPEDQQIPLDSHNQSSEVYEKIGLLPLINRDYDAYDVMSLFTLMPDDFLRFLNWNESSELIDIIFGIYLTNVINAIDARREEANLTNEMAEAPSTLEIVGRELEKARSELENLVAEKENLQSRLTNKEQRLKVLRQESDSEERFNRLRSEFSSLQSHLADLKTKQAEKVAELGETEKRIQRYEDSELIEDMGGIGEELQSLMTIPDRCPVCTNAVDNDQRERFIHEEKCPLCTKEIDDDLIAVEKDYQPDESLFERREEQKEELDELYAERDDLEFQIDELEDEINSTEEELAEIENTIAEQQLKGVIEQRKELEQELRELRNQAVEKEVQIDRKEDEIERLSYEVKANEHLSALLDERKDRDSALRTFRGIVISVRKDQRRELQTRLRTEIEQEILPKFTSGMFANARGLEFDDEENYHFTIFSPTQQFKSSRAQSEAAETTLHALIFHAAILKLLAEEGNVPPIEMLVIDSPLTNDMDVKNKRDVVDFISTLPAYLDSYQLIISMAESDADIIDRLEQSNIPMEEFDKGAESEEEDTALELGSDERGVA